MGTNYYLRKNYCDCCKRYDKVHIGKSSVGWKFLFYATDELRSAEDWFKELSKPDAVIIDEYGQIHDFVDFQLFIKGKCSDETQKGFMDLPKYWTDRDFDYLEEEFS